MTRVLNKYKDKIPEDAVYVGRPSKWGNPFSIGRDGTREQVLRDFRDWLPTQPHLIEQAKVELRGKDLVCFCAPLDCHARDWLRVANAKAPPAAKSPRWGFKLPR